MKSVTEVKVKLNSPRAELSVFMWGSAARDLRSCITRDRKWWYGDDKTATVTSRLSSGCGRVSSPGFQLTAHLPDTVQQRQQTRYYHPLPRWPRKWQKSWQDVAEMRSYIRVQSQSWQKAVIYTPARSSQMYLVLKRSSGRARRGLESGWKTGNLCHLWCHPQCHY